MTERNGDAKKSVKNQLFNVSVTGATFEDFSQNAILFPVQDVPSTAAITPNETSATIQPTTLSIEEIIKQPEPQEIPLQESQQPQLSSVFSSFSNILSFGGSPAPNAPSPTISSPTGYDNVIGQNSDVLESVPLIHSTSSSSFGADIHFVNPLLPPTNLTTSKPSAPPQGIPGNLYRRSGPKKPTYAQIPGLLSARQPSSPEQPMVIGNSTIEQHSLPVSSFHNTSQSVQHPELRPSNNSNQFQTPLNYFQPIPSERLSPASNPSLRSTPAAGVFAPVSPTTGVLASISPAVSASSSILQPEPPSTLIVETTSVNASSFDNSSGTKSLFNSGIFSHPPTVPYPSTNAAAILNPIVSSAPVPFFNPAASKPTTLFSPVMAALPDNEIPHTSSGMASIPNPSSQLPYGSQNGMQPSASSTLSGSQTYRPVYNHWFFKKVVEGRIIWQPFSMLDSLALEEAFVSANMSPETIVSTDGGRYDVNVLRRERFPVYWTAPPGEVRRCSWFHKGNSEGRFIPYEENIATLLEDEFRTAFESNEWHRAVELPNGDSVVFHGPDVLVLFPPAQSPDSWGNTPQTQPRPCILKRGMDEFDIDEGEPAKVDHLLFLVHGIGSVCDLKFRTVTEVVDEFRSIALQLVQSHYRSACDSSIVNRVEVLPISWHGSLHNEETGIDKNLKNITLESIPRLRDFTNDTLLDILFYTSPIYSQTDNSNDPDNDDNPSTSSSCNSKVTFNTRVPYGQTILTTVGSELNRIFELFKKRNPSFAGGVSLGGHSLGSLILFDLLCHQHPEPDREQKEQKANTSGDEDILPPLKKPHPKDRRLSRRISYMMSEAGTGQPQLHYPHLHFQPNAFFALGSPIGMFITVRGLDKLGHDFALPTCPGFFNIFHPYDPVAYRIESLINPELAKVKPVLIPHHKGRKRMHLELKETMVRVGADLKQKLVDSMKSTWNTFFQIALFGRQDNNNPPSLEAEVDRVFEQQLAERAAQQAADSSNPEEQKTDLYVGILNKGRRIDYVLQEAPFEFINEYIFALTSHVCYWESEDTMLLMLKEIYASMGISPNSQIPQQTMTIERPCPSPKLLNQESIKTTQSTVRGVDPTLPMSSAVTIGPPPTIGFVKKT